MDKLRKWIKNYLTFGLGTVFGAVIASVTCYMIFALLDGDPEISKLLQIQECLMEKSIEKPN